MTLRKYIKAVIQKVAYRVSKYILGTHPNNTVFSFNYHNVSHINRFLKRVKFNLSGNQNVLVDIGSGKSPYYSIFSDIIKTYIAVDTPDSLPSEENRPIQQIPGFAEALPLESASADIVLCNQVLEHVQDPIKATADMFRVLKPGGRCIGSVPHVSPVHLEPYDFRRYTDLGLEQLLKNAGFVNISIEGSGGVYSAAALMVAMDWMLTIRQVNKPQGFSVPRAVLLSPLVGMMNITAIVLDTILTNNHRTPANLCWSAQKPLIADQRDLR